MHTLVTRPSVVPFSFDANSHSIMFIDSHGAMWLIDTVLMLYVFYCVLVSWCKLFIPFVKLMGSVPCSSVYLLVLVPPWAMVNFGRMFVKEMHVSGFEPRWTGHEPNSLTTWPSRIEYQPSIIDGYYPVQLSCCLACVFCLFTRGTDLNLPGNWFFNCHGRLPFCLALCKLFHGLLTRPLAPSVFDLLEFLTVG